MGREALSIGANTMQFFTRNPRGSKARRIDPADTDAFLTLCAANGIRCWLAHAPYTLNPCSANPDVRQFALETMRDDLQRLAYLPGSLYNFHPGSHTGQGAQTGVEQIASLLNDLLSPDMTTTVLLETMAGKGSEVGGTFEELAMILERVECGAKLGVCLDTCHVHDGGYDIAAGLDAVLETFDRIIGLERLKAVHLNDSKNPCGARKDRHEKIGQGFLGTETFARIINHPSLRDLPFYLETPNELAGYAAEIALLKSLRNPE